MWGKNSFPSRSKTSVVYRTTPEPCGELARKINGAAKKRLQLVTRSHSPVPLTCLFFGQNMSDLKMTSKSHFDQFLFHSQLLEDRPAEVGVPASNSPGIHTRRGKTNRQTNTHIQTFICNLQLTMTKKTQFFHSFFSII